MGDFPSGPVVRTWCSNAEGPGSISGRETKIPHATGHSQKKKKKNRENKFGEAAQQCYHGQALKCQKKFYHYNY